MDKDFWRELFVERVDLNPPGYDQIVDSFTNNPYVTKTQKKAARSGRKGKFPGMKHGAQ